MEGRSLAMGVAMTGAVAICVGIAALFGFSPPPSPDRPKPPPPPDTTMNSELRYSRTVYQGTLAQDARAFHIAIPTFEDMARPNPYFEEFKGKRRLKTGDPMDTPHLKLSVEVTKMRASIDGQAVGSDHVVLKIENKTGKYLAYRAETTISDKDKCASKGDLPQNAIVLRPNQTISRTECLYRNDGVLDVTHVEVIELAALPAYYVSRLPATSVLYDPRTAAGHEPLAGKVCPQTFSWRDIREGLDGREIGWRDVIDFYARHNCDEYSFFRSYRYRTDPAAPLPVRPLD